jgi:hypothetical protein
MARTDRDGRCELELEAPAEPGGYVVVAERIDGSDGRVSRRAAPASTGEEPPPTRLAEEVFVVELGGDELADPRGRPALLRELAERTGGTFTTLGDAGELARFDASRARVREIVRRRPFASPFAVLGLVVLFGVEWILRRRWGA